MAALCVCALLGACGSEQASGWREGPSLPQARLEAFAAVSGGRLYYLGGITGVNGAMETAEASARVDVFDPGTNRWSLGPELPALAPKHHLAVAVHQGRLYVLGGFDGIIGRGRPGDAFRPIATSWVLEGDRWRRLADAPLARGGATAQSIGDRIYVAGGTQNEGVDPYATMLSYDPIADRWETHAPMPTAREHVASCVLAGQMLVAGGWVGAPRTPMAAIERYDPAADQWTRLPPMSTARGGLGAGALNGRCLVVGGEDWLLPPPGTFAALEAWDPVTTQWSTLAPMRLARHGSGVALFNGELWVLGGGPSLGNSYTARVEIYRP